MKIYLASRVPCEHQGRLVETLGASHLLDEAIAMCSLPIDSVIELESGKLYPPGEVIGDGVRTLFPHCPKMSGWQVSKGLAVVG